MITNYDKFMSLPTEMQAEILTQDIFDAIKIKWHHYTPDGWDYRSSKKARKHTKKFLQKNGISGPKELATFFAITGEDITIFIPHYFLPGDQEAHSYKGAVKKTLRWLLQEYDRSYEENWW